MNKILVTAAFLAAAMAAAQVGINNADPKATLDITAKTTDSTKPEGIIAPRLTGDQIKGKDAQYLAAQTGTIVYATSAVGTSTPKTVNITAPGYYYFDGTLWTKFNNGAAAPVITSDNGLTKTGNNIQLGGALTKATIVTATAANTLAIPGLQTGAATDNVVLSSTGGVLKTIPVATIAPVITSDNGLTKTGNNIQLGGALTKATIVTATAANTLAIPGLQTGAVTDNVVLSSTGGVLKMIPAASLGGGATEPWYNVATNTGATANTQNIYQTGNVGIGISTPANRLSVVGSAGSTTPAVKIKDNPATTATVDIGAKAGSGTNGYIHFSDANAVKSEISYSTANDELYINSSAAPEHASEVIINASGGRVGIGTFSPAASLDVSGTLKYHDGSEGNTKVLTSDAFGNATWKSKSIETVLGVKEAGWNGRDIPTTMGFANGNQFNYLHTGAYIDLPVGKWMVNVVMLMKNLGAPYEISNADTSFWVRSTFTTSNADMVNISAVAPYIQGSYLISGNMPPSSIYSLVQGAIVINNTGTATTRYYYVTGNVVNSGSTKALSLFGGYAWAEDQIVAYRID